MDTAVLCERGQITIPKQFRTQLGLLPSMLLTLIHKSDNEILSRTKLLVKSCLLTDYLQLVFTSGKYRIWTRALQRAIDENEIVIIPPSDKTYWIDSPLVIPSNRRIEAYGATISLTDGSSLIMLRNENAADGTLAPACGKHDENISITGGTWCDCSTERMGYGRSGCFNDAERKIGNFFGISTLFCFSNCDYITVTDVTFANTGAFAVQSGNGKHHLYKNIVFRNCFADGLHLNGNLSCIHVENVKGDVGDDLVALNAYDWLNSSVCFGPQDCILCEDLELISPPGKKSYPAIRIQPAQFRYQNGDIVDCSVSNVIFRRVKGIETFKMYLQTPPYNIGTEPEWSGIGSGGNIYFEGIDIDLTGPIDMLEQYRDSEPLRGHFGAFEIGANISSVTFRDITIRFHLDKYPLAHLVTVGPKSIFLKKWKTEIFDPYVSCNVGEVTLEKIRVLGEAPDELIRATVFNDINHDGHSSGCGRILKIKEIT